MIIFQNLIFEKSELLKFLLKMKFLLPLLLLGNLIADCTVQCETLPGTCSENVTLVAQDTPQCSSECVSQFTKENDKQSASRDHNKNFVLGFLISLIILSVLFAPSMVMMPAKFNSIISN